MKQSDIVIEKMREVIAFRTMYELCMSKRESCNGCPFWKEQLCTKKSMMDLLVQAADVFEEFLAD